MVDGLPVTDPVAATPAETPRPSGAGPARAKRKKTRPAATSPATGGTDAPGPAGAGDGEEPSATAAGPAPASEERPGKPAAISTPPAAEGPRPIDVGAAATASDPLAVPELVALPLREDQAPPTPVGPDEAEADARPQPDRASAPNPALAALAFLRGGRRTMIRSRKVRRVIRHVDPWSVLTFSVIFHLCLFAALLLAGTLVWSAASASGTIDNLESFVRDLGDYETWEIQGDAVLRAGFIVAGMLTLASTIMVVLLTVVFNLISDLVGGIRVTVIEEEVHHGAIPGRNEGAAPRSAPEPEPEPDGATPVRATTSGPEG